MGSVVTPEHTALPSPRVPSDPRGTRDSSAPTFCPHAAPLCLPAQCEPGATSPGVPLTPAQGADSPGRREVWGRHGPSTACWAAVRFPTRSIGEFRAFALTLFLPPKR